MNNFEPSVWVVTTMPSTLLRPRSRYVTFHEEPGVDIASFQQADESAVGAGAGAGAVGAGAGAAPGAGAGAGEGALAPSESPPPQAAIATANDSKASVPNRFK